MINNIVLKDLTKIIDFSIDWKRFSGKTILISGANGFLPAYMVETLLLLLKNGIIEDTIILALVRNIDKAKKDFVNYLENDSLKFIIQDVSNPIQIECNIDFIIHAASQASPKYYGTDPVGTVIQIP